MTQIARSHRRRAWARPAKTAQTAIWLLTAALLAALQAPAQALPAFARKYKLPCERCHSMMPRLNTFGYRFYRAGFRLLGANKPLTVVNSTDLLSDATAAHANPGHSDTLTDDTIKAKFIGTLTQNVTLNAGYNVSLRPTVTSGFDELWLQYNSAAKGTFWSFRVGQTQALNGYNLLGNRNISLTDPQLLGAFGALSGDFGNLNLSGLERGFQVGYTSGRLSTRVSLLSGIQAAGDVNNALSFHDYLLQTEYFLGKEGSVVQAFAYVGKTPLDSAGYTNNFQRSGLFGTWGHTLKGGKSGIPAMLLELNAGLIWGEDQVSAAGERQNSLGTVLEASLYLHNRTAFFARYDGVRLGSASGTPTTDALTAGIVHRFSRVFKAELELREQRAPYNASILAGFGIYL